MRVALVQRAAAGADPELNLRLGAQACESARELGADLVVFPELWQVGYTPCPEQEPGRQQWLGLAITDTDPWLVNFQELAARLGIAVITTFLLSRDGNVYDAAAAIDHHGQIAMVYTKVHVCDFTWERVLTPGRSFTTAPVQTRSGQVHIGVMICYDREFPESARTLALDGAELIVCPNACLICDDRLGQLRARAFENMTAIAMANYPIPVMNGRSCVFDGRAVEHQRPRDHRIALAGPRAGIVCADIDLPALRAYRQTGIWGGQHRRPETYARLITPAPPQPGTAS